MARSDRHRGLRVLALAAALLLTALAMGFAASPAGAARPAARAGRAGAALSATRASGFAANTVAPAAKTFFVVATVPGHSQVRRLVSEVIKPIHDELEVSTCFACGHGGFRHGRYNARRRTYTVPAKGHLVLTSRTRVATLLYRPGEIGRFWLDRLDLRRLRWVRLATGCVAADVVPTNPAQAVAWALAHLDRAATIPRVPCRPTGPVADHLSWVTPWEIPAGQGASGTLSGYAAGPRWLSLFQAHRPCAGDALAEAGLTPVHFVWRVNGEFQLSFVSAPDTAPGYFCMYVQADGLYQGLPDGRLTVVGQSVFYSGDAVSILLSAPDQATFTGTASAAEELYEFFSPTPCAASAQAEVGLAVGTYYYLPVQGPFSDSRSLAAGATGYLCAYLQLGAPVNGAPTGPTLVSAARAISVP